MRLVPPNITPGPWGIDEERPDGFWIDSEPTDESEPHEIVNVSIASVEPEQAKANAHAVAALPDALAALADCLQSLHRLPDAPNAYRVTCMAQARAALLKAGYTIED